MDETLQHPKEIDRREIVYQDRNQIIQKVVAQFVGFHKEYFVSDHGDRAAVVAVRNNEVLLTRQYRLLIDDLSLEVPGGGVDQGEDPADAAARECFEETGVKCNNLQPLIEFHPSLEIWKNYTYIYVADECKIVKHSDAQCWVPLNRCMKLIFNQKICDSLSIIALMAYQFKTNQNL